MNSAISAVCLIPLVWKHPGTKYVARELRPSCLKIRGTHWQWDLKTIGLMISIDLYWQTLHLGPSNESESCVDVGSDSCITVLSTEMPKPISLCDRPI
jgi:hypothetical protein